MRSYSLNIADYLIRFESDKDGPELMPSAKFSRSFSESSNTDFLIKIHRGETEIPVGTEKVFHAPYVEEIDGKQIHQKSNFWSVWKHLSDLYIKTTFPLCSEDRTAVLKFSLTHREWDLWIACNDEGIDPFEYPLDGLILYYLTVIHGDIMIHASGINHAGSGYLFSGVSGKGKSTIARLWENSGARVIHDDRLILRKTAGGYRMYNTPVYNDEEPKDSPVNKIFIIDHGISNKQIPVKGAEAVSLVMANCIQHHWSSDIIARLLGSVSIMCGTIPVFRLYFKPDRNIIDHILENE